jgi:hypothetical protein
MMIDITGPKVLLPATLFILLSPGLFLQLPTMTWMSGQTSRTSVMFHALVFVILYSLLARALNLVLTKMDLIVPAILFILLSPHVFFSVPNQMGLTPILLHALVFSAIFAVLRSQFPQYY